MSKRGFLTNAYFKKEAAFGTEIQVTRACPDLLSNTIRKMLPKNPDNSLVGSRFREIRIPDLTRYEGSLSWYMSFGEMSPFEAAAVGGVTVISAITPYEYRYNPTTLLTPPSFTFCQRLLDTANVIRTFTGLSVSKLTIKGAPGKPLEVTAEVSAKNRDDASATNTGTVLDAISVAGLSSPKVMNVPADAVIRLGDRADALVAGDNLNVTEFELVIDNKFDQASIGSEGLIQPEPSDFMEVTLSLAIQRLSVETYRTWVDSNTELQALLQFTRDSTHVFEIRCGAMTLSDDFGEEIPGPEIIKPVLKFVLHRSETNNPTWSGTIGKDPFELYLKTPEQTTSPLA